ncbi:hypothetical protein NQZ68_035765 [Dissostichus eleginoides]|nr:hypothetical protein NQZ68_035765 [Dissostichus eleginoides]
MKDPLRRPLKTSHGSEKNQVSPGELQPGTNSWTTIITTNLDTRILQRSSRNLRGFNSEMCPDDQSLNEEPLAMNQESPSEELVPLKKRRTRISDKPNYSLNLWSIMKNCIGKELSKIPMPEPSAPSSHSPYPL